MSCRMVASRIPPRAAARTQEVKCALLQRTLVNLTHRLLLVLLLAVVLPWAIVQV